MKLDEAVKGLVQTFWHDNTRPYSNTKDVLKHCRGSMNNEPHVEHYLDMKQTQLFDMFKVSHAELRLGKRYFKKCKPWYVRINTIWNTSCSLIQKRGFFHGGFPRFILYGVKSEAK